MPPNLTDKRIFSNICYWSFCDKSRIFGTPADSDIVKSFNEQNIPTIDSGSIIGTKAYH
ncbi:MAG TPA: hypothetical protein VE619_06695 [Nitrososphaeraceae archaeon]|nr:hypothetical protein [Nitrososphaeraceae archaeon]